jgi:hypothetical protein
VTGGSRNISASTGTTLKGGKEGSRDTTVYTSTNNNNKDLRKLRFDLQAHAHTLLKGQGRACACHKIAPRGAHVVLSSEGVARYTGLARCGDVWACPVCAPAVAAHRRESLRSLLQWVHADGMQVLFITYTASHSRDMELNWLLDNQLAALGAFKSGRLSKGLRASLGYIGLVRSLEVTFSERNGWHPHIHELWICNLPSGVGLDELQAMMSSRWLDQLKKRGLSGSQEHALTVKLLDLSSTDRIDAYMTKQGTMAAAYEMAAGDHKEGRKAGHYTPAQLLKRSADGELGAGRLWLEFVGAYRGRRQMLFGRELLEIYRDCLGTDPNASDENVTAVDDQVQPLDEVVIDVQPGGLWALYRYGLRSIVLDLIEQGRIDEACGVIDEACVRHNEDRYERWRKHWKDERTMFNRMVNGNGKIDG